MAMEFLEGASSGSAPANPALVAGAGLPQAGPVENRTTQAFLGTMGAEDYLPYRPTTPRGPYATAYLGAQAKRVESFRTATAQAFRGLPGGQAYVYTQYSDKANTSFKTVDDLMSDFESMSVKQKKNIAKALAMAGYLGGSGSLAERVEDTTLLDVTEAYAGLLAEASQRFANGQNITVDELLDMHIRYNMNASGMDFDGDFDLSSVDKLFSEATGQTGKPRTETRVDKSVDIFSPEDARGMARQTLQAALGRDPSEDEYEDFIAALQTKARQNPTVTRTTTRYDAEGNVIGTNSVSRGGLGASAVEQFAQDQAEAAPDWAEWQAVGTYFPALMESLSSVVPGA